MAALISPYTLLAHRINLSYSPAPVGAEWIDMLKGLYSPEEAWLAALMPPIPAGAATIARMQLKRRRVVEDMLNDLADRGLMFDLYDKGQKKYMLPVWVPGMVEFQLLGGEDTPEKREFARKFKEFFFSQNNVFYRKYQRMNTSFARVVPVGKSVDASQRVLPYEDVRAIIRESKKRAVSHCYCRQEKVLTGEKTCNAPVEICMSLDFGADYVLRHGWGTELDKDAMLEKLDVAESHNLVHLSDNARSGFSFICNCCGCCCGMLGAVTRFDTRPPFVLSSHVVELDSEACNHCGKCTRTCQVGALSWINKTTILARDRCIGCGNCVSACPEGALKMADRSKWATPPSSMGHMMMDMMGRRMWAGLRLPLTRVPGREMLASRLNALMDEGNWRSGDRK